MVAEHRQQRERILGLRRRGLLKWVNLTFFGEGKRLYGKLRGVHCELRGAGLPELEKCCARHKGLCNQQS
jgi:hypothetical protein